MKPLFPPLDEHHREPLYRQLYKRLKEQILEGAIAAGEKLPSLRSLSQQLGISITTIESAYNQLLVEGYVESRPQSGYYCIGITNAPTRGLPAPAEEIRFDTYPFEEAPYRYDLSSFDFGKWKKCMSKVLNEYSSLLLFESDPQGEKVLRAEIARYVYQSRGVSCTPEQVVISAGTQQLIGHLARIMERLQIQHVATETPGYLPVQNIFRDHGFTISRIPVAKNGIMIEKLPVNIPSAVYVSPSNQFPTGSVMPADRRYQLLQWAEENSSIILEDDYDSELRYFGNPVPALKSLDRNDRVVYFGSFTSTLFKAIRISYMILTPSMAKIFDEIKGDYDQTCSKTEQLTLAMFMEKGYYYTNIRRLRKLYSQKLSTALAALKKYGGDFIHPLNTQSGVNIILNVQSKKTAEELQQEAAALSIEIVCNQDFTDVHSRLLIFYYNQIPLEDITDAVREMTAAWKSPKA